MNNREKFNLFVRSGVGILSDDVSWVQKLVDMLIQWLYVPVLSEETCVVDQRRLVLFKIKKEPVNYGSLKCVKVIKDKEVYIVMIDEAAPECCPTFCDYIERHMLANGWHVQVKTGWKF